MNNPISDMAIDPVANLSDEEEVQPMQQLDAATIKKIVHDVVNPKSEHDAAEAAVAFKQILHTSFRPGLFMIAQFADINEQVLQKTDIEKTMIKILSKNAHRAFRPPYSKAFIYDWVMTDWLVTCVACDSKWT